MNTEIMRRRKKNNRNVLSAAYRKNKKKRFADNKKTHRKKRDIYKMSLFCYTDYIKMKEKNRWIIYNIAIKRS